MKIKQLVASTLGIALTMPVFGDPLPRPLGSGTWKPIPELTDEFKGKELDSGEWMVVSNQPVYETLLKCLEPALSTVKGGYIVLSPHA